MKSLIDKEKIQNAIFDLQDIQTDVVYKITQQEKESVQLAMDILQKQLNNGWISVEDRLPEKSDYYLVYCGDYDGVRIIRFERLKTKVKWISKSNVTHWQPLPEPPKSE